jgi:hypothetical protein
MLLKTLEDGVGVVADPAHLGHQLTSLAMEAVERLFLRHRA